MTPQDIEAKADICLRRLSDLSRTLTGDESRHARKLVIVKLMRGVAYDTEKVWRNALEMLVDAQNGPPFEGGTARILWDAAINRANELLGRKESNP